MQTVVFHPGTQHSRQTALALDQLGRLAFLATSLFEDGGRPRWPAPFERWRAAALAQFEFAALDPARVRTHGRIELAERLARRAGLERLATALDGWGNRRFGRWVADQAVAGGPLMLWGYNNSALAAFADPRLAATPKILDMTIADWRVWTRERAAIERRHGDWLGGALPVRSADLLARDDAEYAAATRIVCGSPFVAESLRRHSPVPGLADKLVVLPYPFDAELFGNAPPPVRGDPRAPVRFLFAGQVSARKGIQHALEAIRRIPERDATLTVVGPPMVPDRVLAPFADRVRFVGRVPRRAMPELMRAHEALVFPSHFEGSALTLIEALASGLAVIQTPQAGLGATAHSGLLVTPDADAVEAAMRTLIDDRARLFALRQGAHAQAPAHDFARYRAGIASLLAAMGL